MKISILTDNIIKNNAIFKQVLGLCPTLAVTTSATNGLGMGLATTAVLICSSFAISLVSKYIPAKVRIPSYIVIIATFVTVVDLVMNAYLHDLHKVLGLFIPLIVVNCLVLGRAESYASKNKPFNAILDAVGSGLGFTLTLFILGAIREFIGIGSILNIPIMPSNYTPVVLMILPPGAFITLGLLMALYNFMLDRKK